MTVSTLQPLADISPLGCASSPRWVACVTANFDRFLLDHAAAEKKASGMAMSMLSHYPDRAELVTAMSELAVEELVHFREVLKIVQRRGLRLGPDRKDPYVAAIRALIRQGPEYFLLDRLLTASIIEARGAERFALVASALPSGELKRFYTSIARSEERHYELFLRLARLYFSDAVIDQRWIEIRAAEAGIVAELPIRAALH